MEVVVDLAGIAAGGGLLLAYVMLSRGLVHGQSTVYQGTNMVGSALIAASSAMHEAWPSVAVNTLWLAIGVVSMVRMRQSTSSRNATARG